MWRQRTLMLDDLSEIEIAGMILATSLKTVTFHKPRTSFSSQLSPALNSLGITGIGALNNTTHTHDIDKTQKTTTLFNLPAGHGS
jgi:hypothetical protein